MSLNSSAAGYSVTNTNPPTSSLIYQFDNINLGASGQNYIVYAFHSVAGYSKIGSYTGTGSTSNRPVINTGFEPAFVMIKRTDSTGSWYRVVVSTFLAFLWLFFPSSLLHLDRIF